MPKERLELSWVTPIDFESIASAIPPLRHICYSATSLLKKWPKINFCVEDSAWYYVGTLSLNILYYHGRIFWKLNILDRSRED